MESLKKSNKLLFSRPKIPKFPRLQVEYGRLRVFDPEEGEDLAKELLLSMADRTSNISLILQCNVGVIAGYHLLVRHSDIDTRHMN